MTFFFCRFWGLNSGPHACTTQILQASLVRPKDLCCLLPPILLSHSKKMPLTMCLTNNRNRVLKAKYSRTQSDLVSRKGPLPVADSWLPGCVLTWCGASLSSPSTPTSLIHTRTHTDIYDFEQDFTMYLRMTLNTVSVWPQPSKFWDTGMGLATGHHLTA